MKRLLDVAASSLGLVLAAPLLLLISLLIKADSRGSIFYQQWRMGKGEKPFQIYKFRTMFDGADQHGPAITLSKDGRITRVGRVLRRFELDELPTLFNVLKGEMSIVGPRPELPKYLCNYSKEQRRVFLVRPGMTDPGTLRFRDETRLLAQAEDPEKFYVEHILPEKLKLNLEYIDHQEIFTDLSIILRTWALIVHQTRP